MVSRSSPERAAMSCWSRDRAAWLSSTAAMPGTHRAVLAGARLRRRHASHRAVQHALALGSHRRQRVLRQGGVPIIAHENTKLWLGMEFTVAWENRDYLPRRSWRCRRRPSSAVRRFARPQALHSTTLAATRAHGWRPVRAHSRAQCAGHGRSVRRRPLSGSRCRHGRLDRPHGSIRLHPGPQKLSDEEIAALRRRSCWLECGLTDASFALLDLCDERTSRFREAAGHSDAATFSRPRHVEEFRKPG